MVVRINRKFHKLFPTGMADHLHPHHHPHSSSHPSWSAAAEAFEADVSGLFRKLFTDAEPAGLSTGKISLPWLRLCLETLPYMNGGFARLITVIDHPISSWGPNSSEEYLSYTLNLLEHLNEISSAIAHLGHARVSLAHALSVSESSPTASLDRLKAITAHPPKKDCGKADGSEEHGWDAVGSGKDAAVHKAINFMKGIEFWVCGIVISALSGDAGPYLEMRASAGRLLGPSMSDLDSHLHRAVLEKGISLEEVRKINDSVAHIVDRGTRVHEAEEALHDRLDGIEKLVEGLRKEVDLLFSQVLSSRNALLDCLRAGFS
ncbi:hypothetical protein MLD38_038243 [Melastoma candidum]|uniref:Uncharacterized protein n=1 Tax=Melastoma candidum TaxID=119954 RepID=A0ACB9KYX7_9MYRT|nr:hypothetical protein MLD38_038243 [Melastoma candidum]